jgi:hypothetical protein
MPMSIEPGMRRACRARITRRPVNAITGPGEVRQQQRVRLDIHRHQVCLSTAQHRNEKADGSAQPLFDLPRHQAHDQSPGACHCQNEKQQAG